MIKQIVIAAALVASASGAMASSYTDCVNHQLNNGANPTWAKQQCIHKAGTNNPAVNYTFEDPFAGLTPQQIHEQLVHRHNQLQNDDFFNNH